jgi:hypothetical protein
MAENEATDFEALKSMLPQAAEFVPKKAAKNWNAQASSRWAHLTGGSEWSASPQSRDRDSLYGGMGKWILPGTGGRRLFARSRQGLTLVTYDRRTIPPLLKTWAEEERTHGGVVFVDEKTISPADIGGLVWALTRLARETGNWDWTNRIYFQRRWCQSPRCDREDKPFRISALRRDVQRIADEEQRMITQICEMLLYEGIEAYKKEGLGDQIRQSLDWIVRGDGN